MTAAMIDGQLFDSHGSHGEAVNATVLGMVAHDLRNPLAAVLALASRLHGRTALPDDVRDCIWRIRCAAARMDGIVEMILELTRLMFEGHLALSRSRVDLAAVATEVAEELRAAHSNRRIDVTAEGDAWGEWDGNRLSQVVSNLVGNALVHGATDCPVEIRMFEADGDAVLTVTNEGPTIPAHAFDKLFEPFWQAPSDEGGRRAGLGLGLFIARQIVHAHAGTIDVCSKAGVTTFAVRLPRAPGRVV